MDEEEVRNSVSRRRMLKRAGVGAAIVWSAPVLTSLATPAHAETPVCTSCPPPGPREQPCNFGPEVEPRCGASGPANICSCLRDVDTGQCFCHEFVNCGDPRVTPTNGGDCPRGWHLAFACCDGQRALCYPECGTDHHLD